ncbi:MAG: MFS transporter, partial [Candidatus Nitrosopolaris sp.]
SVSILILAKRTYPNPREIESKVTQDTNYKEARGFSHLFWVYLSFVVVSVLGYVNFQLISYNFKVTSLVSDAQVPVLFAIAMGTDALVALIIGRLFDKKGLPTLIMIPIMSIFIVPLVFSRYYSGALVGVILWGAVMGIQDTIMRATIPNMIPAEKRGLAYGIFNTAYGTSWFVGSTLMGILYDISIPYLILFSVISEVVSIPLLIGIVRQVRKSL